MCSICAGVRRRRPARRSPAAPRRRPTSTRRRSSSYQRQTCVGRGVGAAPRPARAPAARRSRAAGCARCQANQWPRRSRTRGACGVVEVDVAVEPPVDAARAPGCSRGAPRCSRQAASASSEQRPIIAGSTPRPQGRRQHGTGHRDHGRGQGHPHEVGPAEGAAPAGRAQPIAACAATPPPALGPQRTVVDHRPWRRAGGGRGRRRRACASCARSRSSAPATPCSRRCRSCTTRAPR